MANTQIDQGNTGRGQQGERGGNRGGDQDGSRTGDQGGNRQGGRGSGGERGFAAMDAERQREIASMGGRAAHRQGTAHEFDSEEARAAGRRGGEVVSQDRVHMAEIGALGGRASRGGNGRSSTAAPRSSDMDQQEAPLEGFGSDSDGTLQPDRATSDGSGRQGSSSRH